MLGRDAEAGVVAWDGDGQDENWEELWKLRLAQEILLLQFCVKDLQLVS